MYRLMATDLDGTLLNDRSEIPENNRAAIAEAMAAGLRFCICSGRSFLSLQRFETELGLNKPGNFGICFNGSVVYETHSHQIIRDVRMPREMAVSLIRELERFAADIIVYVTEAMYAKEETELVRAYRERSRISLTLVHDFADIREDVSKVLLKGDNAILRKAAEYLRPLTAGVCNMFFTDETLLEFTHPDANKGAALLFLANYLGIPREAVIAAGDHLNDIQMLEAAGLGVAVQSAREETKRAANVVTAADNNAGAIAEIINTYILQ